MKLLDELDCHYAERLMPILPENKEQISKGLGCYLCSDTGRCAAEVRGQPRLLSRLSG